MLRTIIELPNGTRIGSGATEKNVVTSVTIKESCNSGTDLTLGSTCSSMLEISMITPNGELEISARDELKVYKIDEENVEHLVGTFTAEKPQSTGANTTKVTAYDHISWLDKDLGMWLYNLNAWPYDLYNFANMVCQACGLTLINTELPNGDHLINKFSAEGITGRQLIQWVGQLAGRFCRATNTGEVEFAWYEVFNDYIISTINNQSGNSNIEYNNDNIKIDLSNASITYDGKGNLAISSESISSEVKNGSLELTILEQPNSVFYYQGTLKYESYKTAPIEKVQIRLNDQDVGTVYPDGISTPVNTYIINGNYLASATSGNILTPLVQSLFNQLKDVSYTPCKVVVPTSLKLRTGMIVKIVDRNNYTITAYIMSKTTKGQRDTLECTGSYSRSSSTAMNNQVFAALTGKVLNLRTDVDGLKVENANALGQLSRIELDLEGIRGEVANQQRDLTTLTESISSVKQTSDEVKVELSRIVNDGVTKVTTSTGYSFTEEGLRISKSGRQMVNILDENGMQVKRNNENVLVANSDGVQATDVKVRNYLIVGSHARFEDFDDTRTACYYWEVSS